MHAYLAHSSLDTELELLHRQHSYRKSSHILHVAKDYAVVLLCKLLSCCDIEWSRVAFEPASHWLVQVAGRANRIILCFERCRKGEVWHES